MYNDLGKKIKKLRTKKRITQYELANILDVSRVQISNIENGRRGMNLKKLKVLCKYFKIDLSYFVSDDIPNNGERLIEIANAVFNSNQLSNDTKDNIFTSIFNIYMDSKEDKLDTITNLFKGSEQEVFGIKKKKIIILVWLMLLGY